MHQELIQRRGALHLADEEREDALSSPPAVVELLPASVCRENVVFPLQLDGPTLHVAAADPSNVLLSDKLSFIVNKNIKLVRYPRDVILDAIDRHYGVTEFESVDSHLGEFTGPADTFGALRTQAGELSERGQLLRRMRHEPPDEDDDFDDVDAMLALKKRPRRRSRPLPHPTAAPGQDTTPVYGTETMWYYTVEEGQRALRIRRDGRIDVIVGPARVWKGNSRFERMRHFVAHPGDFLTVRFRDGRQEHLVGPTDVWFDPRIHEGITRQEALQLATKEAVIVYSRPAGAEAISRRIVNGPMLFVPAPGEW
ncbi:MAG TPA: hypothetical protein VMZ71_14340, partial [Gemmataceae bacterium]|nr:hypothetical protein [Gemmataceae bacterium]